MADVITEILNNNLISEILCVCKKTKNSKRYDNIENNPPFQRPQYPYTEVCMSIENNVEIATTAKKRVRGINNFEITNLGLCNI